MKTGPFLPRYTGFRLLLLTLALGVLAACPPGEPPEFDFSNLSDARFGEAYEAQIYLLDYTGPAAFTQVGGELPTGLSMNEAGTVSGTPEYLGTFTFEVMASGLNNSEDAFGTVSINVVAVGDTLVDAFVGYEHDQLNNMSERLDLMRDIWLRVTGGGIEGLDSWTMNPGVYLPGPNGVRNGGDIDDVRIGDVSFSELTVEFSNWDPTGPVEANPPGYPSEHNPEGSPPSYNSAGTFSAGADGGEAEIRISHPDYEGAVDRRVMLVPPDWCPIGEDFDGGPGGWSTTRYCDGPKPEDEDDD